MRIRTVIVLVVLLLVASFLVLNWGAITAVAKFSLVFTTVEAPVGLVMLSIIVLLVATFAGYVIVWQGASLLDARRRDKQLQAQRQLAEQAEASRFVALRDQIREEFARLADRIAQAEEGVRAEIRDSGNSLAASLGEIDDRLQRTGEPR